MNNCSVCGWGVAWCVDKEDKGTYWLCGRCAVDDLREKIPQQRSLVSVVRVAKTNLWQIDTLACATHEDGSRNEELLRAILEITLENQETFKELPEGLID